MAEDTTTGVVAITGVAGMAEVTAADTGIARRLRGVVGS